MASWAQDIYLQKRCTFYGSTGRFFDPSTPFMRKVDDGEKKNCETYNRGAWVELIAKGISITIFWYNMLSNIIRYLVSYFAKS